MMHTAHLLTISQHALPRGLSTRRVSAWGISARGVSPQVCLWSQGCVADTPHGQTDTCENITFANFVCRWKISKNINVHLYVQLSAILCSDSLFVTIQSMTSPTKLTKDGRELVYWERCPFNDSLFTDYCLFPDCLVSKMYSACIIDQHVTSTNASFTDSPSHPSFGFQFLRHNLTPGFS